MTKTQESRLQKINDFVENDNPFAANKLLSKTAQQPIVYTALREAFEKAEIQLTTDKLVQKVKNQVSYLENIQQKVKEKENTLDTPDPKLWGVAIYASKMEYEWLKLIFQLRGDLHEVKMQIAQQFNINSEKDYKASFQDFVIQTSGQEVEFEL